MLCDAFVPLAFWMSILLSNFEVVFLYNITFKSLAQWKL